MTILHLNCSIIDKHEQRCKHTDKDTFIQNVCFSLKLFMWVFFSIWRTFKDLHYSLPALKKLIYVCSFLNAGLWLKGNELTCSAPYRHSTAEKEHKVSWSCFSYFLLFANGMFWSQFDHVERRYHIKMAFFSTRIVFETKEQ